MPGTHAAAAADSSETERNQRPPFRFAGADLLFMLLPWAAALLLGVFLAQRVPVTGPAGLSLSRATFFVANAASLTGFEVNWARPLGPTRAHAAIWLIAMTWTTVLSLLIPTAAFAHATGKPWTWAGIVGRCAALLVALWSLVFICELLAARGAGAAAWDALTCVAAAGQLATEPAAASARLWLVLFPAAALMTIGPFVLWDSPGALRGRPMSPISRVTWMALPVTFALAVALVVAAAALDLDVQATTPALIASEIAVELAPAALAAVDARSAGFTDAAAPLPAAARWALVPVMLLGGAPGGVGGGLKALAAAVLVIGVVRLFRGRTVGRTFAFAAAWLVMLAVLFFVNFVLLVHALPQLPSDRVALLAAGACANVGMSVDPVTADGADGHILAITMLLGRSLPWLALWWSATRGDGPIAVG